MKLYNELLPRTLNDDSRRRLYVHLISRNKNADLSPDKNEHVKRYGIILLTRVLDSVLLRPQSAIRFATNARHHCRGEEAISPAKTGCYSPLKVERRTESLSLSLGNHQLKNKQRPAALRRSRHLSRAAISGSGKLPAFSVRYHPIPVDRYTGRSVGHKAHQFSFLVCEKFPRPPRHKSSRIDSAQMWNRLNVVENFIGPRCILIKS